MEKFSMNPFGRPVNFRGDNILYRYKITGKYVRNHKDGSVNWQDIGKESMTLSTLDGVAHRLSEDTWLEVTVRDLPRNKDITIAFDIKYGKSPEEPRPVVLHPRGE